jgi:hypothetical protein
MALTLQQIMAGTTSSTSTAKKTLTLAEIQSKRTAEPAPTPPQGFLTRVSAGVGQAADERKKNVQEAKQKAMQGTQTHAEGFLQATGQFAGLVGDTTFTAAKEAVRSVAPSAIPVVKNTVGAAMQTKPAQAIAGAYGEFKETHPRAAANVEAVGNIAGIIPQAKVGQIGAKLAGKGIVEGTELAAKGAAKAGAAAKNVPSRTASILTNVPKEDFEFAANPRFTPLVEKALQNVGDNEKQPYFELANRTATAINDAETRAAQKLQQAKLDFKSAEPTASFDVRPYKQELAGQLQTFQEYGIELRGEKNFRLTKTAQSPFSERELDALNRLLGKINASNELDVDNLLALAKSLNAAYDEIPLGVNGTPRPYHAVLMSIKAPTEKFIDNILPPHLRSAFDEYSMIQGMKQEIGNKVIDGNGNLKDTAEQFLANMGNMNKGNVRLNGEQLRALTGIDINNEVRAMKVAQRFSNVFPTTGSRTQDVVRSIIASGLGGMTLGPVGMAVGVAATSPKLMGKAAIRIGKSRAEGGAAKRVGDYLKDVQPGLSTKDVTAGKLEATRDYLIQELGKAGRHLDVDIEQEASDFIDFLQDSPKITSSDVNRAMEILRLQGKPDAIEKLRTQLGATAEQARDSAGRFAKTIGSALKKKR